MMYNKNAQQNNLFIQYEKGIYKRENRIRLGKKGNEDHKKKRRLLSWALTLSNPIPPKCNLGFSLKHNVSASNLA